MNVIREICKDYGASFLEGVSIAPYTSFKIGGKCNIVKLNGVLVLRDVLAYCKRASIPYRILGKGSNVLISDKGLDGVVLLFGDDFADIRVDAESKLIECQAGARLSTLCKTAALHSLTGIEFAYGIPGTVGGALYMNAGAYGGEMAHVVESCIYLDADSDCVHCRRVQDMNLSYRRSVFGDDDKNWLITVVKIRLNDGDKSAITARMDEITAARRDKQPLEFHSAGSTFKRPLGHFAAKLIQDCGLKGAAVGGAEVSEKHSGFVINKGGASFDDVVRLIDIVKNEVYRKTGVTLEREILVWE